ncbi:Rep family protein [Streptomyces sp. NPDC052013]|uniref:Rep family protein n=1 Tax=Streptomyces sp. NPDC052013 TaxID=3365679 RepID=UPI0037D93D6D
MTTSKRRVTKFMYTQQLKHLKMTIDDIKHTLELNQYVKDFAMIVHDSDVDEHQNEVEPHLHVFLKMNQQKSVDYIADLFKDTSNYVEFFNKNTKGHNEQNGYLYLLHKTKNAENKHQYDMNDLIVPNDSDLKQRINKWIENYEESLGKYQSKRRKTVVESILNDYAEGLIDKNELRESLTNLELAKHQKLIKDIDNVLVESAYLKYIEENRQQNKKVIWIFGEPGAGKTFLSHKLANQYTDKDDIFVTSSNRDPFEDYFKESVLILEEFRTETNIGTNELLQLLDKTNPKFSAGSRYHNKKIMADLIIVNSIRSPDYFMPHDEPLKQLTRRIDTLIKLDSQRIMELKITSNRHFEVINSFRKEKIWNENYKWGLSHFT